MGTAAGSGPVDAAHRGRLRRHQPDPVVLAPLGATVFNLVVLRDQVRVVAPVNDWSVHLALARWARRQVEAGQLPLDGWYPNLGLGISISHHYQSLPDVITGLLSWPLGVDLTLRWLAFLLLATWPVSIYLGVRLLGWDRAIAAAAALVSPLLVSAPGYGLEAASYTWQGLGLYTQLWGAWLLPIACGLAWQAVDGGRRLWAAVLALGLLATFHFLTAYLALLFVAVYALAGVGGLRRRLTRALVVGLGALGLAAFVLVPVLVDGRYTLDSMFNQGTFWKDSWGAAAALGWLSRGQLFDEGRLPIVTGLAAIGLVDAARRARRERNARALLGMLALSLVLFSGRPTFGWLLRWLPGSQDLLFHRFISGVHLAGIVLAGLGLAWSVRTASAALPRRWALARLPLAATAMVAVLAPTGWQFADRQAAAGPLMATQLEAERGLGADLAALAEEAARLGGGRVYAGNPADWGAHYRVGYATAGIELLNHDAQLIGFNLRVPSLPADAEASFDSADAAQYRLLGIRYVIAPDGVGIPPPALLIGRRGALVLWEVGGPGYLEVADAGPPVIRTDRAGLGRADLAVLRDHDFADGLYHAVAFAGASVPPARTPPGGRAGSVLRETSQPSAGRFAGQVRLGRSALVVLKASFDPHWEATVDGRAASLQMVAPGYPAVQVAAGDHLVDFRYRGFEGFLPLFLAGVTGLLLIWAEPRRRVEPAAGGGGP